MTFGIPYISATVMCFALQICIFVYIVRSDCSRLLNYHC